jgi:hypothetical protein
MLGLKETDMAFYTNRQLFSDHWLRERLPSRAEYALTPLALARFALWAWERFAPREAAAAMSNDGGTAWMHDVTASLEALNYTTGAWQTSHLGLWPEGDLRWQIATVNGLPAVGEVMGIVEAADGRSDDAGKGPRDNGGEGRVLVAAVPRGSTFDERERTGALAPSAQLLRLLAASDAAGWGILSDGVRWRLYQRAGDALEAYYEVDLAMLAAGRDLDALKYAWLFFAAQAHLPGDDGRPFLEIALAESRAYAAGIEDDLRARAFDAISAACQALADALAAARNIPATLLSREDLRAVYTDALALLYRLLFILYAESRGLLPVENSRYHDELSLRAAIESLPAETDGRRGPRGRRGEQRAQTHEAPRGIWARLRRLFRALNDDERPDYVPAFKGRLFDHDTHPLLRDLTPADEPLARMLALLGRTHDGRLIDYADLAIRQLGGIYEGLLEHQAIAVAEREMALVKGPKDKAPLLAPLDEAAGRRVLERYPPGTVYLSNDKGERHAAGTYYTPDPVVRYLVNQTLGPLVAGKSAEEILRLRVLDPAMGSGHFLVAVVDYLARAALAAEFSSSGAESRAAASREPGRETLDSGVMALKRRIAEQCIYGVDLNEAAVELAKLSLWLATAARDLPLTFLDAHLRTGNSLVGLGPGELEHAADPPVSGTKRRRAKSGKKASAPSAASTPGVTARGAYGVRPASPASASTPPEQPGLWDESGFTQNMFRLVGGRQVIDLMDSRTAEDVRAKADALEKLDPLMAPYRRLADLAVSQGFGNQMAPEVYAAAAQTLLEREGAQLSEAALAPALAEARRIAERQRVFHWELAFPEVFRDTLGRPRGGAAGFDALLGNPPYVSVNTLRSADPEAWGYFPRIYQTAAQGKYDLYAAFVERGLALLNAHGRLAYILPNKWLTTDAGAGLRSLLTARRAVRAMVDFGSYQVFPGVSNYTCLLFAGRDPNVRVEVAQRIAPEGEIALPPTAETGVWALGEVEVARLSGDAWDLNVGDAQAILNRMRDWPMLGQQATVFVGTCTNANPVFILREQWRDGDVATCWSAALERTVRLEAALLRPVLQGRDIAPYACDDGGNRLLFPYRVRAGGADLLPREELEARYPLTWAYLSDPGVRTALEGRENGRFKGRANWYGYGYPRNMHLLGAAKLVLPDVAARGRVAYDAAGSAIVHTAYGVVMREDSPYASLFVLAALNSPILAFFLRHRGTDLRGGYFRMMTGYLNPFPLPPITWELSEGERRARASWALARIHSGEAKREPPVEIAAALAHLPAETLHDTVVGLAEHAGELAVAERTEWQRVAARVAVLRPAQARDERVAALLTPPRPGVSVPPETADAVLVALEKLGPALTAPELEALREAFRAARESAQAASQARDWTVRLIDLLLYRLYGLSAAEIAIVEGDTTSPAPKGNLAAAGAGGRSDAESTAGRRRGTRRAPQSDDQDRMAQEAEGDMRTVTKGSQPQNIVTCLDLALERPYCAQGDMNRAMGYVEGSATGPHYVALAWLAGLLDEQPVKCWLRPTAAGRAAVRASKAGALGARTVSDGMGDAARMEALWDALLGLPAYQRYLLNQFLDILVTARAHRDTQLATRIEELAYDLCPSLRERVDLISERLGPHGLAVGVARTRLLAQQSTLEPLDFAPLRAWAAIQGCGPEKSDFTRTERIALLLARAAQRPLRLDAAWLKPSQVQVAILLATTRERQLGCVIGHGEADALVGAAAALARGGVDLRIERRGGDVVAALAQPVAIHVRDMRAIEEMARQARGTPLEPSAALIADTLRRQVRSGADGVARGALDLEELGQACLSELRDHVGEPATHPAATEAAGSSSQVIIGPPLPLPSDLPRLGLEYHFLDEAMRVRARREAPGVAALLTNWLTQQEGSAETLLALSPHLALLYLVAADTGAQAELLGRGPVGWTLDGVPLVTALDARLRGLGYEVWDERYADNAQELRALGEALVEQGLRTGVLRTGRDAPLDAPDSRWYFKAIDLLAVMPAGRNVR